jgi:hypothetical protein
MLLGVCYLLPTLTLGELTQDFIHGKATWVEWLVFGRLGPSASAERGVSWRDVFGYHFAASFAARLGQLRRENEDFFVFRH